METHPAWLKRSAIPMTIVCGPPCSGKTTYVHEHAAKDDTVIDLDTIYRTIRPSYRHWSTMYQDTKLLHRGMRVRNMMLASLCKRTSGKAWFIVGAPTEMEREWWRKQLGGVVVLLNPGIQECRRRAYARGTPLAAQGVDRWFTKAERHWHPPAPRSHIGINGLPLREDEDEADVELGRALSLGLRPVGGTTGES